MPGPHHISRRVRATNIAGTLAVAFALSVTIGLPERSRADDDKSIYQIDPIIDGAIIGASVGLTIGIYVGAAGSIDVSCPCDRNQVNAFDRPAIGNHSDAAAWISNVTVGAALLTPVALDWLYLRQFRPFVDDMVVYAQAIALSGAFVTVAKQLAQRPFPRTYAGERPTGIGPSTRVTRR